MKYSKDGKVEFDPIKHTYKVGDKFLESVTGKVSKYKEEFDTERISGAYALKNNLKKEDVIKDWANERDISTIQGWKVHEVIENYVNTDTLPDLKNNESLKVIQAVRFIQDFFKSGRLIPVEAEVILYNQVLAGTCDLIAKNKKEEFFILDWKTNKKIDQYSYRDKRMQRPFSQYMDCNFYHYSLQVGLYKKLAKEYPIKECFIVHFDHNGYSVLKAEDIFIPEYIMIS